MSPTTDNGTDELEPVTFQPLPNIITAFSADASAFEALSESIDNSVDYVRSRAYDGDIPKEELKIRITFDAKGEQGAHRIIIEDNAGGVKPSNLSRFFQWGASVTAPESIGRFGVGASRIAALGGKIQYQSRAIGEDQGYGFEVDVSEMEAHDGEVTDETYQAERQPVDDLAEGNTRIIISDLKREFTNIFNISPEESESADEDEIKKNRWQQAIDDIADQFGDYFEEYITDGINLDADYFPENETNVEVSIGVQFKNDDFDLTSMATPPSEIAYSYLPFDSLGPRRYTDIPFDESDEILPEEASIQADIEVGLMLQADDTKAGLTLYANDRKIISRNTSNPLFSSDYLGPYRSESGHSRLVVSVELNGDIDSMPVNSMKSDFDMNSPIADPLLRITKNAVKRYRKQTYSSMPSWILGVYDSEHPYAANGGAVDEFDKSTATTNSARFRKQPGSSGGKRMFPDRDRLRAIVKVHRALRIRDSTPLKPMEEPAYTNYFETQYVEDIDSEFAPSEPHQLEGPDLDWLEVSITADETNLEPITTITRLANDHFDRGGRADQTNQLHAWQIPRYREELCGLAGKANLDETDLEVWEEIPKASLLSALNSLANSLDRRPTADDMDELGPYKASLYAERFDTWDTAIGAAGLGDSSERGTDETEDSQDTESTDDTDDESQTGFGDFGSESSPDQSGDSNSSDNQEQFDGVGVVVNGEAYRIPEAEQEMVLELLDVDDNDEPATVWQQLKEILEWYQQMPNR